MEHRYLKSCFIAFIIFFMSICANAQPGSGRFSIRLATGAAIPIGKFGKKTLSYNPDSSYGLAKPGPIVSMKAGYQLNKQLSLSLLLSYMLNREDKKAFESGGYNTAAARSSITVNSWKTFSVLLGPAYIMEFGKNGHGLIFIPSIHVGVVKTGFPGDSAVYFSGEPGSLNYAATASWRDKFPLHWAFAYQASADILYALTPRLFIDGSLDFFNSVNLRSAKYENDPRRFKLSTINIQVGIRIFL